jgi:pectate lyase
MVTSLADGGVGSLREALEGEGARWVRFAVSGAVNLTSDINVKSYKTVYGRNASVTLRTFGLRLVSVSHVIIHNLCFDGRQGPVHAKKGGGGDAVKLKGGTRHVWVDHCSFLPYPDGLVDITRASTDVTVSYCRFEEHNKVMLIGADPEHTFDSNIRVTVRPY